MDDEWEELFDKAYEELTAIHDVTVQRSTLKQRAADAHPILITLAQEGEPGDEEEPTRVRSTTEYGILADQIESNATYIWKVLVVIDKIGAKTGDPPVSPLVESEDTVGPGHGYFDWAHLADVGINIPQEKTGLTDEAKKAWRSRLREAYEHDEWYWAE